MAYTPFDSLEGRGSVTIESNETQTFSANGQEIIELPSGDFIADAQMTKDGHDLVLQAPDGSVVVIEGYFLAEPAPVLQSPDGSALTPQLVDAFAKAPAEFAQTGSVNDESPVGAIEELSGEARITRTDGTVETVQIGTPIYQGDIVETSGDGAVNIVFIDETSFAISENARMAIDEYVFDPATESGKQNFSVLRGVFVFTSGLIGRDDPDDVEIDTPVGSIGIRGTVIAGDIQPGGDSEITVIEGAIVIRNGVNEETLSLQFESVKLSGYDQGIERTGVMDAGQVNENYGAVRQVSPTLFSSLDDAAAQEQNNQPGEPGPNDQPQQEAGEAPQAEQPAGEDLPQQGEPAPEDGIANQNPQNLDGEPAPQDGTVQDINLQDETVPADQGAAEQPLPGTAPAADVIVDQTNFDGQNDSFTGENTIVTANNGTTGGTTTASGTTGTSSAAGSSANSSNTANDGTTNDDSADSTAGTGTTTTTPPLGLEFQKFDLPEGDFNAGFIVGTVKTTNLFGTVEFSLNGGQGYFELVRTGTHEAVVKLTAAGYSTIAANGPGTAFNFTVTAVRNGTVTKEVNFSSSIFDPTLTSFNLDIDSMGTADGYVIRDDLTGGQGIGNSIAALGDINNDGRDDFVFTNRVDGQNHVFVVRSDANGSGGLITSNTEIQTLILATADNSTYTDDTQVIMIGDVNGDGFNDFAVAQAGYDATASGVTDDHGRVMIYSGNNGALLDTITGTTLEKFGTDIATVGDVNNDGNGDFIVASGVGQATLVQWDGTSFDDSVDITVSGTDLQVGGLGDYDGDGKSDAFISFVTSGDTTKGAVNIYYGSGGFTGGDVNIGNIDHGGTEDIPVTSIGEFSANGVLGLTDIAIAERGTDTLHIVRGDSGSGNVAAVSQIEIHVDNGEMAGGGSVGDFNGDGWDDIALITQDGSRTSVFVVYGGLGDGNYNLSDLYANGQAFKIKYNSANSADDFTISSVGDVNGDGFDDFAIGSDNSYTSGGATEEYGEVAVVYGRNTGDALASVTATGNDQNLVGTAGANIFEDNSHTGLSMIGGAGDDEFKINGDTTNADKVSFRNIDGGNGFDYIRIAGGVGDDVDFTDVNFEALSGIEQIRAKANNQTITLNIEQLFNMLQTTDETFGGNELGLYLSSGGNTGVVFEIEGLGTTATTEGDANTNSITDDAETLATNIGGVASDAGTFDKIEIGGYNLYISEDATVNLV